MRVCAQDGSGFVSIRKLEVDSSGNVHVKVRARRSGFEGSNKSVWFERAAVEAFLEDMAALERTRQGNASLETIRPDECRVIVRSFERLGHIHVDATISRCIFFYGETDWLRCRIRFEIDPTGLSAILEMLRSEFGDKGR